MNEVGRMEWPRVCYQCQVFTKGPGGLGCSSDSFQSSIEVPG